MAESMLFVLFIIVLALLGYASYLRVRLARIEKNSKRADNRIARYRARIAEWQHYADYLESELSRFSTEYAGVRLDYDISRGKIKAAPVKAGNGEKAYALTLPGMAIPADCEVMFEESPERIGALVVNRKPEQKSKNGAKPGDSSKISVNSAAKSEKAEKQTESTPSDTNKRDPQSVISEIEKTTGKLESHEADRVVTWLKTPKTCDKPVAEYAKWIAGIRKSKK